MPAQRNGNHAELRIDLLAFLCEAIKQAGQVSVVSVQGPKNDGRPDQNRDVFEDKPGNLHMALLPGDGAIAFRIVRLSTYSR
jgi:hypothetical protein